MQEVQAEQPQEPEHKLDTQATAPQAEASSNTPPAATVAPQYFAQPRTEYTIINTEANRLMEAQLTADETEKLHQFTARLEKDYPKDVKSTETLIRFLRARKWNLDNAEKMYRDRMKWVQEFKPHLITEQDVAHEIKTGKMVWYGKDLHGRPILNLRTRYHIPSDTTPESMFKYMIYMAELGMQMLPPPPYNQFIMISDRLGTTRKNFDPNTFKRIGAIANYYPETLGNILVVGANWIFWLVHKFVSTFLDPVTMGKMILLSNDEEKCKQEMRARVKSDEDLLPEYGGHVNIAQVIKALPQAQQQQQSITQCIVPNSVPAKVMFGEETVAAIQKKVEEDAVQKHQNSAKTEDLDLD